MPEQRILPLPLPAPLPDADALRRAALAASWRRDRRVGTRRLVWRYTQWMTVRYLAPAVVLFTVGFVVYLLLARTAAVETPPSALSPPPEAAGPGLALRLDLSPGPSPAPPTAAEPASNPPGRNAP